LTAAADGRSRVALVLTGGSLNSVGVDRLDLAWYIEAGKRLEPGEFLARIPEVAAIAAVEEVTFRRMNSHALTDRDWLDLLRFVQALLDDGRADGVVIGHGTNTLEETAYFLNLTLKSDRPVVLVGGMRPAKGMSSDGELNVTNAIRVAAAHDAAGRGVLVVMNDSIFGARDVTKGATYRLAAFQARDAGPLGWADADGTVQWLHRTEKQHTTTSPFDVAALDSLPRVDVVVSYVGADGAMIDAAVAAGARGIVSAGTGAGRPTPAEDEALERAHQAGVVICQSSRVGSGRVVAAPALVRRGFVAAGDLQPWKARVLLQLALGRTSDATEIQAFFDAC
jgi:L-asparaginase